MLPLKTGCTQSPFSLGSYIKAKFFWKGNYSKPRLVKTGLDTPALCRPASLRLLTRTPLGLPWVRRSAFGSNGRVLGRSWGGRVRGDTAYTFTYTARLALARSLTGDVLLFAARQDRHLCRLVPTCRRVRRVVFTVEWTSRMCVECSERDRTTRGISIRIRAPSSRVNYTIIRVQIY